MRIRVLSARARRSGAAVAVAGTVAVAACAVLAACGPLEPDTSPLATQRAGYVDTMLQNSYAGGPETERGIMSVIAGYGGGYVTSATLTGVGASPSEKLTLDVVIGAGAVSDGMQGETDRDASDPHCYTFTLSYYGYEVTDKENACPSALTTAAAQAAARRQIAAQIESESYWAAASAEIPGSLSAAEASIGFTGKTPSTTAPRGSSFAAGQVPGGGSAAGLAVPQPGGACVFVAFRSIRATSKNGTHFSTSDGPAFAAWAAPTSAPCQGSAALAAGAFLTVDSNAGG